MHFENVVWEQELGIGFSFENSESTKKIKSTNHSKLTWDITLIYNEMIHKNERKYDTIPDLQLQNVACVSSSLLGLSKAIANN